MILAGITESFSYRHFYYDTEKNTISVNSERTITAHNIRELRKISIMTRHVDSFLSEIELFRIG